MTADEKEQAFLRHVYSTENYFAAVRENGGTPWWEDPEHLAKLELAFPGISKHPGIEARRMFFTGRYTRPQPPERMHTDLAQIRESATA
ncbi:hypothetical protein AU196_02785 [Mycobacterium sp. IS-1742]|uniref:hypothetical protein n=1 Tax=Mycobacterium sp. IS-1742 TaxID=1772285 RepID=UPI0007405122|nr:hypothetical protein [Mycobacterium sp. IS-1742]KUI26555.1 hypothetical protein AU196_02785 [Mycobacterium sp. IS-1742]